MYKYEPYKPKNEFAEKTNYITDRKIIIGSNMIEYDISQANINILKAFGDIDPYEYTSLKMADKQSREILIGRKIQMQKNESVDKTSVVADHIRTGIIMAKDRLLTMNRLNPLEIIRIANDAVYVERPLPLQYTKFDILNNGNIVEFFQKGQFSSFIKLGRLSVFVKIISDENIIVDVKGINDENIPLHEPFLEFICNILFYLERTDINTTLAYYNDFYSKYINMELPIEYYREFNSDSDIRIKAMNRYYGGKFIEEKYKHMVDINYNLLMLRETYAMILSLK